MTQISFGGLGHDLDGSDIARALRAGAWSAIRATRILTRILTRMVAATLQHAEQMLMGVVEALGGCERIVRTTVPSSYSRHTSRVLRRDLCVCVCVCVSVSVCVLW